MVLSSFAINTMLKNALQKLVGGKTDFETYTLLRMQAKTYRLVKNYVSPILAKHKLSTLDWSLLGLLKEYPEGCRFIQISQQMGVEPPFITELVSSIKKNKLIKTENDQKDKRAKILVLTKKGEELVEELEKKIQDRLVNLLNDVSSSDFTGYINIMNHLSKKIDNKEFM